MILSILTGRPIGAQQKKNKRKPTTSFLCRARHMVERLRRSRSTSTTDNYCTALRSLERFLRSENRKEAMLSRDVVEHYDRWLNRKGVSPNTRSCYLRSLRALHRRIVGRNRSTETFSTVFTGNAPTRKRALPLQTLRRLQSLQLGTNRAQRLARDVFFFSLFALGMPFADVALLQWHDLHGGYFVYHRRKTGVEVRVRLEPCMREIAERWRDKSSDRVFPLVPDTLTGEELERAYRKALGWYNRQLRLLAVCAHVPHALSSYCARHTWATMAYAQGMELPLISTAMGHRNTQTTMVYIARKEHTQVARMNKKLLESICSTTFCEKKTKGKKHNTYCKEV